MARDNSAWSAQRADRPGGRPVSRGLTTHRNKACPLAESATRETCHVAGTGTQLLAQFHGPALVLSDFQFCARGQDRTRGTRTRP